MFDPATSAMPSSTHSEAYGRDSSRLEFNMRPASPTRCMRGHKRPCSPAATTGSLSTLATSSKRPCMSTRSDSRQTQSLVTASRFNSQNGTAGYARAQYTALTSVQCSYADDDDDDLDEALSSFRGPPGHPLNNEQGLCSAGLSVATTFSTLYSASVYSPTVTGGCLPFRAVKQGSLTGFASDVCQRPLLKHTLMSASGKAEMQGFAAASTEQVWLLYCLIAAEGISLEKLVTKVIDLCTVMLTFVQQVTGTESAEGFEECSTYCHPAERALYQMQPRAASYHQYSADAVPKNLDIEE